MDTAKDASLRLCGQVVEERDAAVALLRKLSGPMWEEAEQRSRDGDTPESLRWDALCDEVDALLARIEGGDK